MRRIALVLGGLVTCLGACDEPRRTGPDGLAPCCVSSTTAPSASAKASGSAAAPAPDAAVGK